jgi:predicted PurR-regulated permease PerM
MSIIHQRQETQDWGRKSSQMVITLACLMVVLAGMKTAAGILVPMACAFFLAVLSFPLLAWQVKHRIPGPVALITTMLVNLGVVAVLATLAVRLLISFNRDLPRYLRGLESYMNEFAGWL